MERDSSLIFILTFFHHICLKFHFWFYYEAEKTIMTVSLSILRGYQLLLENIFCCHKGQHHEKGLSLICWNLTRTCYGAIRAVTVLVAMFTFSSRNWTTFYLNFTFSCNYFKTFFFTKYFNYMIRVKWYLCNPDSSSS